MMGDYRTNKYGVPWCRRKVEEMFGKGCLENARATSAPAPSALQTDDIPF